MSPKLVALALLVLGAAMGVVGNWLKPPARMGGRAITVVFTVLLILAGGITYVTTAAAGDQNASDGTAGNDADGRGIVPASASAPASAASAGGPAAVASSNPAAAVGKRPPGRTTTRAAAGPTGKPGAPAPPCIVGTWALTTIVDYISYSDETVTMSYDGGWETRIYRADGTFSIANDWQERGYGKALEELTTHSNGTAEGRYEIGGGTATYDPVTSVGNWTFSVDGEVRRQSSVIFSRGEESVTCTSGSLKVVSGGDYKASYRRK